MLYPRCFARFVSCVPNRKGIFTITGFMVNLQSQTQAIGSDPQDWARPPIQLSNSMMEQELFIYYTS